jgi:hypothetical protein
MARCVTCGAVLGPDAEWCGQCYALVRSAQPEGRGGPAAPAGLAPPVPISTNGDSAEFQPPARPTADGTSALAAAAVMAAAIPPDLQITLASGSSRNVTSLGDRGKAWVTALIVLVAASSDALFFPYTRYMVVYGLFVSVLSGLAIWRLWARRSIKH